MYMYVYTHTVFNSTPVGQRRAFRSQFSLSSMCITGIKFRSSAMAANILVPAGPVHWPHPVCGL